MHPTEQRTKAVEAAVDSRARTRDRPWRTIGCAQAARSSVRIMSNDETAEAPDVSNGGDAAAGGNERTSSRLSNVIIALTTILAIVSVFSVWARTQLLDSDEWVDLAAELVDRPEVQDAVATYLVEQVYADDNVTEGLEQALPEDLDGLAGALAGVIRGPLTDSVATLLDTEQFQQLWASTNGSPTRSW